jgi:chaperonin GroES
MKLTPIEDRVVCKPVDAADMTSGGVILPDMNQEGSIIAKVIAVGPGRPCLFNGDKVVAMVTKVDDLIALPKFGAQKIEVDGEECLVVKENEILTIMEETDGK